MLQAGLKGVMKGFKETVRMNPGEVTAVIAKYN